MFGLRVERWRASEDLSLGFWTVVQLQAALVLGADKERGERIEALLHCFHAGDDVCFAFRGFVHGAYLIRPNDNASIILHLHTNSFDVVLLP